MKKLKIGLSVILVLITVIVTLLVKSTISIGGGDSEWDALWTGGPNCYYGSKGNRYGFLVSDVTAAKYNNIYCIEHGDDLESKKTVSGWSGYSNLYNVRAVVTLTGSANGDGYVKYYDDDGFWFGSDAGVNKGSKLTAGEHNRIMAAILNSGLDEDRGMWTGDRKWKKLYKFTKSFVQILGYMD